MTAGRWIPGWTETHTQALQPLDFEREDIASGNVWPDDCSRCGAPRTDAEAKVWPELCADCAS